MLTLGKPQDTIGYAQIQIPYKGENQIHITASVHQGVSWRRTAKSRHAAQNAETLSAAITEIRTDIDKQLDSNYLTNCFHCSVTAAVAVATRKQSNACHEAQQSLLLGEVPCLASAHLDGCAAAAAVDQWRGQGHQCGLASQDTSHGGAHKPQRRGW